MVKLARSARRPGGGGEAVIPWTVPQGMVNVAAEKEMRFPLIVEIDSALLMVHLAAGNSGLRRAGVNLDPEWGEAQCI